MARGDAGVGTSEALRHARPAEEGFARDRALERVVARVSGEVAPPLLGRFVLMRLLGAGAHGQVYDAQDLRLDRRVALKVITDAGHEGLVEARALARVQHPGVVNVHEFIEDSGCTLVVMQYVQGRPLSEPAADGPLGWRPVVAMMCGVAQALGAVHRQGVVHCDVKPSNIIVGEHQRATLIDFSLAGNGGGAAHAIGTPRYMAPELLQGQAPTPRSDQYAFFGTLCAALTSGPVFGTAHTPEALAAAKNRGLDLDVPRPGPRALWRVIQRGLDPLAAARFESMQAAETALRRILWRRVWIPRLALGVALGGSVAGWGLARRAVCEGASTMGKTWSDSVRAQIEDGAAAADLPPGSRIDDLLQQVDDRARTWSTIAHARCDERPAHQFRAPALSGCMDDARRRLAFVVDTARASPRATVAHADALLSLLTDPARCSAGRARTDGPTADLDAFASVRRRLLALQLAARTHPATVEAEAEAAIEASVLPACAWRPDLMLVRAKRAWARGELPEAASLGVEAAIEADACDRPELEAETKAYAAGLLARAGRIDEAIDWAELAAASARRNANAGPPRWRLDMARGTIALASADARAAEQHFAAAEADQRELGVDYAEAMTGRIAANATAGDPQGVRLANAHVAEQTRRWGPSHPRTARALRSLGNAQLSQHSLTEAAQSLHASAAIWRAWGGEFVIEQAKTDLLLGVALQIAQPEQAAALLSGVIEFYERELPRGALRGEALTVLARVHWSRGDVQAALAVCREASDTLTNLVGPDDPATLYARASEGRMIAEAGQGRRGASLACKAARPFWTGERVESVAAPAALVSCLRATEKAVSQVGEGALADPTGVLRDTDDVLAAWADDAVAACQRPGPCGFAHFVHGRILMARHRAQDAVTAVRHSRTLLIEAKKGHERVDAWLREHDN